MPRPLKPFEELYEIHRPAKKALAFDDLADLKLEIAARRQKLLKKIGPDDRMAREIEDMLAERCWFDYRRLTPAEKTIRFVHAYDEVFYALIKRYHRLDDASREKYAKRGHYLSKAELENPMTFMARGTSISPRWKNWERARQSADKRFMRYVDFVGGAIIASIVRGWEYWPNPRMLTSWKLIGQDHADDKRHDISIEGWVAKKYEKTPLLSDDPYFTAAEYVEDPLQIAYYRHVAREFVRARGGEQAAERAWRRNQKFGKIASCLNFYDALR